MRLEYKDVSELAVFGENTYIKPEYFKTYYCVLELENDYYSTAHCGMMSKENRWYEKGYYVIPVYLSAHKWVCGNKIVLHSREFCYMFGQIRKNEPQDVPRENWYIASNFKKYWGLTQTVLEYFAYIENVELYTDVYEAIERAKILDKYKKKSEILFDKAKKLSNEMHLKFNLEERLEKFIKTNSNTSKLKYELGLITLDKRKNKIKILTKEIETLTNELEKIEKFKGVKKGEKQYA
jgi:hypothetical protein